MKRAVSLLIVLAILISVTVIAFTYPKKGEELLISKDNISYDVSASLYGVSLDNINFAYDGGLASNLVSNNSFEYEADRFYGWNIDALSFSVQNKDGLNENNQNYLSVTVDGEGAILNNGYTEFYDYKTYNFNEKKKNTPDMGFEKGEKYEFSAYFKNVSFEGSLTVSLKASGNTESYNFDLTECEDWTKIIFQIESEVTADGGLLISANGTGTFLMDFVTLVPTGSHGFHDDEWKYTSIRTDLYEALSELSPKFVRFSGGLFAEIDSIENLYSWKSTIGPLEARVQTDNSRYGNENGIGCINSNAMGYYEYFMLCSDLGASPIPVISAGISNQSINGYADMRESYKNGVFTEDGWQTVLDSMALKPGTDEWDTFVQDVLDLIEFANGSTDTRWGAVRAENGHEEPFNMQFIAIGDEAYGDIYWRNFDELYKAIKAEYPEITVIASSGADTDSEDFNDARSTVNSKYPDVLLDEHYFTEGGYLFNNLSKYDSYERNGAKVMVGEWSVKSNGYGTVQTKNNVWSAIEEAAYLTGIEKNADVVSMISYAPALAKVNAQSTDVNLIWFNSKEVCLTPDYYTQMLFANNFGTQYISTDLNMADSGVYESVTVDTAEQVIYVKLVNSEFKDVNLTLNIQGFGNVTTASNQYLSETFKAACNEVGEKLYVAPKEKSYELKDNKLNFTVEGLSVNVIRIPYGEGDQSNLYVLPETGIVKPFIPTAFKVVIPCVITSLLIVTGIAVLANRHSLKKRRKNK
ncbi:MAG: hypothetical protein J1F37_01785 [Oscillospiraceae bacterium]|nr:hypothetical protein [Oscillospiraceae bacterium]